MKNLASPWWPSLVSRPLINGLGTRLMVARSVSSAVCYSGW